ncbi:hypothetical protein [Amycolatopsis lexingtonensis]|uniref:hypothetical protein n=1 Tax=Amycolatopsis lexingtonensis TaxID=218822 RepID=UPI003F6F4C9E
MTAADTLTQLVTSATELASEVDRLREENRALKDKHSNAKKLTAREVQRIRDLWSTSDWTQTAIADAFDVNPATVSRIVRGIYHSR